MKASRIFLSSLFWSVFKDIAVAEELPCGSLSCKHGSQCVDGNPEEARNYHTIMPDGTPLEPHINAGPTSNHYCDCLDGWTGAECSIRVEYCDRINRCYHGGRCVAEDQGVHCDCEDAIESDGSIYIGKYCEYKADTYCDHDKEFICLNDGLCAIVKEFRTDANQEERFEENINVCICEGGYEGQHCEYRKPECGLPCRNGGICNVEVRHHTLEGGQWGDEVVEEATVAVCKCQPGFDGSLCEIPTEPCGGRHCLNGGVCSQKDNTCQCTELWTGPLCDNRVSGNGLSSATADGAKSSQSGSTFVIVACITIASVCCGIILWRRSVRYNRRRQVIEESTQGSSWHNPCGGPETQTDDAFLNPFSDSSQAHRNSSPVRTIGLTLDDQDEDGNELFGVTLD